MRRRWPYLIILASLLLGVLGYLISAPEPEPSYGGRSLSAWLDLDVAQVRSGLFSADFHLRQKAMFTNAISQMGTNAVPYLVKWIKYETPPWKNHLNNLLRTKLGNFRISRRMQTILAREYVRAINAVEAMKVLGQKADGAVETLVQSLYATDTATSYRAAMTLGSIGQKGLPPLLVVLTNGQGLRSEFAATALGKMGTNALPAIPLLFQSLQDNDPRLVCSSLYAMGQLKLQPDLVVPAIQASLNDSRKTVRRSAVYALENFGAAARPAVLALRERLEDPESSVRIAASNALRKIEGNRNDEWKMTSDH